MPDKTSISMNVADKNKISFLYIVNILTIDIRVITENIKPIITVEKINTTPEKVVIMSKMYDIITVSAGNTKKMNKTMSIGVMNMACTAKINVNAPY